MTGGQPAVAPTAPTGWVDQAACRDVPVDTFYPDQNARAGKAKAICERCTVRAECLAWGVANERYGIWGGTSEEERITIRKRARRLAAAS